MSHWADAYVGLRGDREDPCWRLVRRVWAEQCGVTLPLFDGSDDHPALFAHEAVARGFASIPRGAERPFDAVLMREAGAERHIGVVAAPGLVLHVSRNALSCVEPMNILHVSRILRPPFA